MLATVNAGSLAQPGSGVEVANARPGYLEYLVPIVQRRRAEAADGTLPIVDSLIGYRQPDGSELSDTEAAIQLLGVFIGGTETVPKIVAHGLWELSGRPDQMAAVRADLEANVPVARDEMIRYCAPAQWFARTVRKPYPIHGTTINPGQRIITLLASANRDEREYPDPDEFIWNRPIARSLAFGRGQHFCLGFHLARLEIAVLVQEWLKRVPEYHSQRRGRVEAAVELPVGLEQHPGRGLTVWSYRLVAPYTFERTDLPDKSHRVSRRKSGAVALFGRRNLWQRHARFPRHPGPTARRHRRQRR